MQAQAAWFYPNPLHGTAVYMPIKPDPPGTTTPNARFSVLSSAVPDPWPTSPGVDPRDRLGVVGCDPPDELM